MSFIPVQPTLLLSGGTVAGVLTLSAAATALVVNNNASIGGTLAIGGAVGITLGNLNLSNGSVTIASTGDTLFQVNGPSGNQKLLRARTANASRWDVGSDATNEGGGNSGSNFIVRRYNDAGVQVDIPLTIARNTGTTTLIDAVSITGPLTAANVTITGGLSVAAALNVTNVTISGGIFETSNAMTANNINLFTGSLFTKTITAATTLTVSNVPAAGNVASFILELSNGGGFSVNWLSGTKWAAGSAPTLSVSGLDILGFYSSDGGLTWRGLLLGKGMA
jgi:hypothetical protein